jgi:hypothetical protein
MNVRSNAPTSPARSRRGRTSARSRYLVRGPIELLEERVVPTIIFSPQFGPETTHDYLGQKLSNPPVYLTFWGSSWTSGTATPSALLVAGMTANYLSSSYMSNLSQYGGGLGSAHLAGFAVDPANPWNNFTMGDINDEVNHMIDSGYFPAPNDAVGTPIYVVVTPPGIHSNVADAGGYHTTGFDYQPPNLETNVDAWIGNDGSIDDVTYIMSHEIDEAASDPYDDLGIRAYAPPSWTQGGDNELCDNEAQNFTARVNGALVQSYWSDYNQAFIVGGQSQNFYVQNRTLFVVGDQTGPNDSITLNVTGSDEVVQENGETATIPLGEIDSVVVQSGAGTDTVNVDSTASSAPVTIVAGSGSGTVNIAHATRDLNSILGNVTVSGGASHEVLNLDNQSNTANDTFSVTSSSVSHLVAAAINYTSISAVTLYGGSGTVTYNVQGTAGPATATAINTGRGGSTVNVQATSGPLSIVGGTSPSVTETVNVGQGGGVQAILGAVSITNPPGLTTVNIDDSTDAMPKVVTLDTDTSQGPAYGRITGLAPAAIEFKYADSRRLSLQTGSGGGIFNIQATGVATMIIGHGLNTVNVGRSGSAQGITAALTIENSFNTSTVAVDDSADTTARTVAIDTDTSHVLRFGRITGLSPAPIEFKYGTTQSLNVQTGGGGDVVNVRSTGVPTSIVGRAANTVNVGNAGSVQGIAAALIIINPPAFTTLNVDDSTDTSPRTATLFTDLSRGLPFGQLVGLAPAPIEFKYADTQAVTIQLGSNAALSVYATGVATNVVGHGLDSVNVGAAGSVQAITAALAITNPPSYNTITVDDSADPSARTVTLDTFVPPRDTRFGRITGLSPAPITFRDADTAGPLSILGGPGGNTFNVLGTINASTTLNAGTGTNTINVQATNGALTLTTGYAFPNSTVNIGSTAPAVGGTLANIRGPVSLVGGFGFSLLNVDDSGDLAARTATLTATAISGLSPAPINFNPHTNGMTIRGGHGGNTFHVGATNVATSLFSGTGNDTVYDQAGPFGNFVVDGQAGTDTVVLGRTSSSPGGTLANLGAPTYVSNSAGTTHLIVDDSGDSTSGIVTVAASSILGFGTAGIAVGPGVTALDVYGGSGGNTFNVSGTISGSTSINCGSGNDTLTLQATGGPLTVNGGTGSNTLYGPAAGATWNITGVNAGTVAGAMYSAFSNLTGGAGLDVFMFSPGGIETGAVNGGGGGDWLDDSLISTPVLVNLVTGVATGTGSASNIQNVRGGNGGNTLVGNAQGNILIGGAGADSITGGTGRSLLIGGLGADTITGGSSDDIVIGGPTTFDPGSTANDLALQAILAEWQSPTDSYSARVAAIRAGVGTGGLIKLVLGATVINDGAVDILSGGAGMDWFFAGPIDMITDQASGEQIN